MRFFPKSSETKRALIAVTTGAVMISFSGVWVKAASVTPLSSAFYRVFLGGIFLLFATLRRHELRPLKYNQVFLLFFCSLLFALDLYFYHYGIEYIGPGLGTILPNFQVLILTVYGALFLGEKIHYLFILAIPLAITGLFMIVGIDWSQLDKTYKLGIYFSLIAAACYAGFLITLRKLQADQYGISIFFVLMLVSFASSGFLGAQVHFANHSFSIPDVKSIFALLALGLLSQSVGWILITNALPKLRASLAGLILLLQPSLAFVWDVVFFHRPTTFINWLGVTLTITAIYMGTKKNTE